MDTKKEILIKRFNKLEKHYVALKAYKQLIDQLNKQKDIYDLSNFNTLKIEEKAILDV